MRKPRWILHANKDDWLVKAGGIIGAIIFVILMVIVNQL